MKRKSNRSKKEKKISNTANSARSKTQQNPSQSRRNYLRVALGLGVVGFGATALHAYDKKNKGLYDLSTIGTGKPTIVQIHDPGCPTCRRLKSIVSNTLSDEPQIAFKLANIKTSEGKALQTKYDVPHVTLLFFDKDGELVHTTTGLQTANEIRAVISRVFTTTVS